MAKQRVLVVDDDTNLLNGLRRQLRRKFDLEFVAGGQDAKARIESGEVFAVVVSDMQMPVVNGLELLGFIKDKSPSTVRIMLTGNADVETAKRAQDEADVFCYLNKPCGANELASTISDALEKHKSGV